MESKDRFLFSFLRLTFEGLAVGVIGRSPDGEPSILGPASAFTLQAQVARYNCRSQYLFQRTS